MISNMLVYNTEHAAIIDPKTFIASEKSSSFASAHLNITGKNCSLDLILFGEMPVNKPFTAADLVGTKPVTSKPLETSLAIHGVKGITLVRQQSVDGTSEWNSVIIATTQGEMIVNMYPEAVRQETVVLY